MSPLPEKTKKNKRNKKGVCQVKCVSFFEFLLVVNSHNDLTTILS